MNLPNLTVNDLAEAFGVTKQVVWRWVREQKIPYYDLPCGLRFRGDEVQAWAESLKRAPRAKRTKPVSVPA